MLPLLLLLLLAEIALRGRLLSWGFMQTQRKPHWFSLAAAAAAAAAALADVVFFLTLMLPETDYLFATAG